MAPVAGGRCGERDLLNGGRRSNKGADAAQGEKGRGEVVLRGRPRECRGKSAASAAAAVPSLRHFAPSAHHACVLRALFLLSLLLAPPSLPCLLSPSPLGTLRRRSLTAAAAVINAAQYPIVEEFLLNAGPFVESPTWTSTATCDGFSRETKGLTCDGGGIVIYMFITGLSQSIPSSLYQLTTLQSLSMSWSTETEQVVSASISDLVQLQDLNLRFMLTGSIPAAISNMNRLYILDLSDNMLEGPLPATLCLPSLQFLNLRNNSLTGPIPAAISRMTDLRSLRLGQNKLSGPIPSQFSVMQSAYSLELNNNELSGSIPSHLTAMESLNHLLLGFNQLTGSIPPLPLQLLTLDLRSNRLEGSVPKSLSSLRHLSDVNLDGNRLEGPLRTVFGSSLGSISLSGNRFRGRIPPNFFYVSQGQSAGSSSLQQPLTSSSRVFPFLAYIFSAHLSTNQCMPSVFLLPSSRQ
ncbi:unnamed protein product [Closterium sp. Naga37s-1]|nr:unnamed protein product [Closterium sp. Naga37s-1]